MKHTLMAVICLICCCSLARAQADPRLTQEERARAIKLLTDSQNEFLEAVEKLSDAQWSYKPPTGAWSVAEVAEHIMLSEGLLFQAMERALAATPNPDWEAKTATKSGLLERALPNRTYKAQAPEAIKPSGKFSRAEILGRFKQERARTLKFIEQTSQPLKAHTLDHPFPVFGTLNAYQWLIYIPLHNMRHNQQIAQVKAGAGFPK